jgi:hypothetical protein
MTEFVCAVCTYPSRRATCDNPRCTGNPGISQVTKDKWIAEHDRAVAQEAERERIRQIRRRMR